MFQSAGQPFAQNAGGGLFGNNQNQASQNSLFSNAPQNANPFANQQQGALFGGNQQGTAPQSTGMFGMNNQPSTPTGGNLFGGASVQQNPFGNNSGAPMFGNSQTPTQAPLFGNNQNQGGVFGATQPQNQQAGGSIFNPSTSTQFKPAGNSIFGGNTQNTGFASTNTQGQGIFGAQNNQNAGTSVFGAQNNQNSGNVFGGSFNNNNNKGLFGGNNNAGTPSIFGGGGAANTGSVFGGGQTNPFGNNNNQGGSVFGNSGNNQGGVFGNSTGGSVFGGNQQNTGIFPNGGNQGMSVFGNNSQPNNQNQGMSVFGNSQNNNNQGMSVFGNAQNNQSTPFGNNTGQTGLFGANKTGFFGATQSNAQTGFAFGNNSAQNTGLFPNQTAPSFGGNNSQNSFGNTSWGVPTGNVQAPKFTPLKPKNTKIDGKHMVKCITLLDQNMNFCKNELRIRHLMTGGSSAPRTQPLGFGQTSAPQSNSLFNANTNTNNASPGLFGGGSVFGGQPQLSQPTGGTLFGGNTGGGNTLFGNNAATGNSFFGNTGAAQNTGFNLSSNNPNQGGLGMFGNNNSGNSAFKPAGGGLFGGSTTAPQGSPGLFGNSGSTPNATGNTGFSFFNNSQPQTQQPATGGLFGNNSPSMFGNQPSNPSGSLFGNAAQPTAQPTGSLFGAGTSLFGGSSATPQTGGFSLGGTTPQGGSMFGQPLQSQPNSLFGGSQGTLFGQSPQGSFGQQQGMFGTTPQPGNAAQFATTLLNGLFNSEFFKKLITKENNTPFDDLKKEAANKYSSSASQAFKNNLNEEQPICYVPRYNKYHRSMYGSSINFNQSPYLMTENDYDSLSNRGELEQFSLKSMKKNKNFPTKSTERLEFMKDHGPIITPATRTRVTSEVPAVQPLRIRKNCVAEEDLPVLDGYTITPDLKELREKTAEELKKMPNVVIENEFGKIKFKGLISLYRKKVSECVKIAENSIDIIDEGWEEAKCELFFFNFGNYTNLPSAEERSKLEKKMKRWIEKNSMREKGFNKQTGELHVEVC